MTTKQQKIKVLRDFKSDLVYMRIKGIVHSADDVYNYLKGYIQGLEKE